MNTDILYILATGAGGIIGAAATYVCDTRRVLELENRARRMQKETAELRAENDRMQKEKNELWDEKISLLKKNTELHAEEVSLLKENNELRRDRTRLLDRINILEKPAPKCQRRLLTRPQLAKIMGVSNSTVTRWQKAGCPSVDGELIVAGESTGETIRRYWLPDVTAWLENGRMSQTEKEGGES